MKTIVILTDSLNRHYLSTYAPSGESWVQTPNLDRLAQRSVTFDNHWLGSAPCMPARRDMLTGRMHFLERGWGGIEPFDRPLTHRLRDADVYCHQETDHYHYFHGGGENYYLAFDSWQFHRGQENDIYGSRVTPPEEPEHLGKWTAQHEKNLQSFKSEVDYPTPATFQGAIDWLQANEGEDDYLLWVECFDPHEPFVCPQKYLDLYDDDWQGPRYDWSGYEHVDAENGDDPKAIAHLRKQYAATVTMMDAWLGKLLDKLESQGIFEETLIIFTTDHGHFLGERGLTGKNKWHCWNELAHIPLIVHLPGDAHAGERRKQLTQNVDVLPTVMDYFGVERPANLHGESWRPALEDDAPLSRRAALYGWHGQTVNVTDGRYTYLRAPASADNQPLYHYFLMPGGYSMRNPTPLSFFEEATLDHFLPWMEYPVIRARVESPTSDEWKETLLFNIEEDYGQTHNLAGQEAETRYEGLMVETMQKLDAPAEQYERLGLSVDS